MGFIRETLGLRPRDTAERVEPLEGTNMSLFNSIIPNFFAEQGMANNWFPGTAALAERCWVAARCIQLNSQQIASMPLEFHGSADEPSWIAAPDPAFYPNGIGDCLHSITGLVYGWGFAVLYVTDFYADGFPRTWTVLDSSQLSIKIEDGRRVYRVGGAEGQILEPRRCVQIDRNPSNAAHGTSALRAYAQQAWGLLAAGNQSMNVNNGGIPKFYLKSERKLDSEQALAIQTQWAERTDARGNLPPVVPPEITPTEMSFDPADMALLDTQEFNAKAIATAYGVPATLLNMALVGGLTYQNPAALGEQWWRFELRPTATRIANALTAQMLPRGQWVTFDAQDTFAAIDASSDDDDPQLSQVASASPTQQQAKLTAIGGTG